MRLPSTKNLLKKITSKKNLDRCEVCKKKFDIDNLIAGHGIRQEIETLIKKDHQNWDDKLFICKADYQKYRIKYLKKIIKEESDNIFEIRDLVLKSINEHDDSTQDQILEPEEHKIKLADRVSDKMAHFGGSWTFIIFFFIILISWIIVNSYFFIKPFDPYPFILMNLVLSCLAAIQAPIIMMSQNRQEIKDRIDARNDHQVNLKTAVEIRTLQEKMDHLLLDQWARMMKIQETQLKILQELKKNYRKP